MEYTRINQDSDLLPYVEKLMKLNIRYIEQFVEACEQNIHNMAIVLGVQGSELLELIRKLRKKHGILTEFGAKERPSLGLRIPEDFKLPKGGNN